MVDDGTCSCLHKLEKLEMVSNYANAAASEFVDEVGGLCPDMLDHVVEQVVVRLVHIAVFRRDENLEASERRLLAAVEDYLHRISRTAPAALKVIRDEAEKKENPRASN